MPVTPFQIAVSEAKLLRLKQKLELSDFPKDSYDSNKPWSRGAPSSDIKRLTWRWGNGFDWRAAEAKLNLMPQYIAPVQVETFGTFDIHFVHQLSKVANAIPLLFVHGWPGSFIEVTKALPLLIEGGKDFPAFHVVAPSLVGFGFSSAPKPDFNVDQHAETYHNLMLTLGYNEYVVQGGDFGYLIARSIASKYGPVHCVAHHVNSSIPMEPTAESHPELHAKIKGVPLTPSEIEGLARTANFAKEGSGYARLLSTKPQTISYSLTDSPIGLLAWIYEKLHDWTDSYPWTDDEVLTWITIYYFSTAGPAAANALYYETDKSGLGLMSDASKYVGVKLGISRFPRDLMLLPNAWNATMGPVVFQREHVTGGHFAAWEAPELLVGDLREMFGRDGGAFGSVVGKSGFEV